MLAYFINCLNTGKLKAAATIKSKKTCLPQRKRRSLKVGVRSPRVATEED